MRITVLAGGIGGARFLRGLRHLRSSPTAEITVIGNTGDDIWVHGLRVCPDLDTVMYTLGGGISEERGWGREGETFTVKDELASYGVEPTWFGLGDKDIATHLDPHPVARGRLHPDRGHGRAVRALAAAGAAAADVGRPCGDARHRRRPLGRHGAGRHAPAHRDPLPGVVDPVPRQPARARLRPRRHRLREGPDQTSSRRSRRPTSCCSRRATRSSRSARSCRCPASRMPSAPPALRSSASPPSSAARPCAAWPTPASRPSGSRRRPRPSPLHYGARAEGGLIDAWLVDTADADVRRGGRGRRHPLPRPVHDDDRRRRDRAASPPRASTSPAGCPPADDRRSRRSPSTASGSSARATTSGRSSPASARPSHGRTAPRARRRRHRRHHQQGGVEGGGARRRRRRRATRPSSAETVRVVATKQTPRGDTRIVQTRHGLVMAAAGVDASNVEAGHVVLLPEDPDASARRIRASLQAATGCAARRGRHRHHGPAVAHGGHRRRDRRRRRDRPRRLHRAASTLRPHAGDDGRRDRRRGRGSHRPRQGQARRPPGGRRARARRLRDRRRRTRVPRAVIRPLDEDLFTLGSAEALAEGRRTAAFARRTVRSLHRRAGPRRRARVGGRGRRQRAGTAPRRAVAVRRPAARRRARPAARRHARAVGGGPRRPRRLRRRRGRARRLRRGDVLRAGTAASSCRSSSSTGPRTPTPTSGDAASSGTCSWSPAGRPCRT